MNQTRIVKLAAATVLLALSSGLACAQSPDTPPPGPQPEPHGEWRRGQDPQRELAMLTRRLSLTPEQQAGVKTVLEQRATQMQALRAKAQPAASTDQAPETREARMAQMEQIRDESNTKIAALLDENQKKIFTDWTQQQKANMERRRRDGDAPPPPPDGSAPPPPSRQ